MSLNDKFLHSTLFCTISLFYEHFWAIESFLLTFVVTPFQPLWVFAEMEIGARDSHCLKLWLSIYLSTFTIPSCWAPCAPATLWDFSQARMCLTSCSLCLKTFFPLPCKLLLIPWKSLLTFPLSGTPTWGLCSTLYRSFMWYLVTVSLPGLSVSSLKAGTGFVSDLLLYSWNLAQSLGHSSCPVQILL